MVVFHVSTFILLLHITKWLNEYRIPFLSENSIGYQHSRRKEGKQIRKAGGLSSLLIQ